jgi:hypothetical protein
LEFDELVTLSETDQPAAPLQEKLEKLLRTPFLSNEAAMTGARPHRPAVIGIGPVLRVVSWNIEEASISISSSLPSQIPPDSSKPLWNAGPRTRTIGRRSSCKKRTDYRDVARDLAHVLGMNYVFGVECELSEGRYCGGLAVGP